VRLSDICNLALYVSGENGLEREQQIGGGESMTVPVELRL
jgi:hypothetical protein